MPDFVEGVCSSNLGIEETSATDCQGSRLVQHTYYCTKLALQKLELQEKLDVAEEIGRGRRNLTSQGHIILLAIDGVCASGV